MLLCGVYVKIILRCNTVLFYILTVDTAPIVLIMESVSKRRHNLLSIEDKITIIKRLENGETVISLATIYDIGEATIWGFKANKNNILKFASKFSTSEGSKKRKTMKTACNETLDEAVFLWFKQTRSEGESITGEILCEKAREINKQLNGSAHFKASNGWLENFKSRHGISNFKIQEESLSKQEESEIETENCNFMTIQLATGSGMTIFPQTSTENPEPGPSTSFSSLEYDHPSDMLSCTYEDTPEENEDKPCEITIKEEPLYMEEKDETDPIGQDSNSKMDTETLKKEPEDEESKNIQDKFYDIWQGNIAVPNSYWTINKLIHEDKKTVSILKLFVPKSGIPIIEKQMIIDEKMQIKWFIFTKEIGSMTYYSEQFCENFMKHFESMKVCYGGPPNETKDPVIAATFQYTLDSYLNVWRHKSCPVVIEDSAVQGNICKFCATITIPPNIAEHNIIESKNAALWRERFKSSQKEIKDLKQVNEDLQKRVTDLQNYIDRTIPIHNSLQQK